MNNLTYQHKIRISNANYSYYYTQTQERQDEIKQRGFNKDFLYQLQKFDDIIKYYEPHLIKTKSGKWQFKHFKFFEKHDIHCMQDIIDRGFVCKCGEPLAMNFYNGSINKNSGFIFLKKCYKINCIKKYKSIFKIV